MEIVQLLSAAGIGGIIGSLLTTIVQSWLAHKSYLTNRNFQEKKEAYVGFIEAGHLSDIHNTPEYSIRWAYWQARCELVGSHEVVSLVGEIEETNPKNGQPHPNRPQVWIKLKKAMRKDLGIQITE